MGARQRPDDPVRVHRRTRRVRPGHPSSSPWPCRGGRDPRDSRHRAGRAVPGDLPRPPSTPAATTPSATWSTGSPAPPAHEVGNDGTPERVRAARRRPRRRLPTAGVAAGDRAQPHLLRRRRRTSGCRWAGSATTGCRCAPSRWRSPTRFLDELFDPPIRWRSARGPPISTRPARRAWAAEYPDEFRALMPELAGYVHYDDGDVPGSPGGYYIVGARHRYDVHDPDRVPRGLPLASLDPLGAESRVELRRARPAPDRGDRPGRARRPRPTTTAGSCSRGGSPTPTATPAASRSPRPASSPPSSCAARTARATPRCPAAAWSTTCSPSPSAASRCRCARSRRVHHDTDTDVPAERRDEEIVSVEYSDGFGRLLQTRTQAEDVLFGDAGVRRRRAVRRPDRARSGDASVGPAQPGDPGQRDRQRLAGLRQQGPGGREVRAVLRHRLRLRRTGRRRSSARRRRCSTTRAGRSIRTVNPDGSEQRVVFGVPVDLADPDVFAPTPWESFTYDANDNAGRTHAAAAESYREPLEHADQHRGRRPRPRRHRRRPQRPRPRHRLVRHPLDLRHPGQPDRAHRRRSAAWRSATATTSPGAAGGWTASTPAAATPSSTPLGNPVESRDSKGALTLGAFDVLHRPIRVWARDDAAGRSRCASASSTATPATPTSPRPTAPRPAPATCSAGRSRHYDEAGLRHRRRRRLQGQRARRRPAG